MPGSGLAGSETRLKKKDGGMKTSNTKCNSAPLDAQLASYSAASRATLRSNESSDWSKRWPAYAAAAGSALALATSAQAGVITSDPSFPLPVTAGAVLNASNTAHVNLNNFFSGAVNIGLAFHSGRSITSSGGSSRRKAASAFVINLVNVNFLNTQTVVGLKNLASGAQISAGAGNFDPGKFRIRGVSSSSFRNSTGKTGHTPPTLFPGDHGDDALVGFDFVTGGQTDYGWIRLHVTEDGEGFPTEIEASAFAYNSCGGGIGAGSTVDEGGPGCAVSASPEPATMPLALLALGSAGVLAWRRRRLQKAA